MVPIFPPQFRQLNVRLCQFVSIFFTLHALSFLNIFFLSLWMHSCSPWRIVDDCGGAFTMGAIGGGVFQSIKGFRNAPAVSSPRDDDNYKYLLSLNFKGRIQQRSNVSGCWTQTERKCKRCQNKSSTDWRWGSFVNGFFHCSFWNLNVIMMHIKVQYNQLLWILTALLTKGSVNFII